LRERVREISNSLGESERLYNARARSLELLESVAVEPSPLYSKYIDTNRVEVDLDRLEGTSSPIEWEPLEGPGIITRNGELISKKDTAGVEVLSLKEGVDEKLTRYLEHSAIDPTENRFSALISAFYSSGSLIYVNPGNSLRTPLRLITLADRSFVSRNLIIVGKGSSVVIMDELYSPDQCDKADFHAYSTEVHLEDNASVKIASIQAASQNTRLFNIRKSIVGRSSSLDWSTAHTGSRYYWGRVEHVLDGEGASARDMQVMLNTADQAVDLTTDLTHASKQTSGTVMVKGALRDQSRMLTKGMIRIAEEAQNSQSYLAQHAIMLSPDASGTTIPGLEVSTNDVKATHSSSVAQLDKELIFYAMSRGLDKVDATKMIALGFLESAIAKMPIRGVREGIRKLLDDKWDGKVSKFTPLVGASESVEREEVEREMDIFGGHYKYR
jgi:Fe-S cluster assembly protein SufB/Fe-S cluster assembly protein SufD